MRLWVLPAADYRLAAAITDIRTPCGRLVQQVLARDTLYPPGWHCLSLEFVVTVVRAIWWGSSCLG
jgi:hypothetical protein